MESNPLHSANSRLLGLQHALQACDMAYLQINSDDSIESDPLAKRLLGLKNHQPLKDLADLLVQVEEAQHAAFLDALDEARRHNREMDMSLRLAKAPVGSPAGFRWTARPIRLPDEATDPVCGLLRSLPESALEAERRSESALAEVRSANAELANFASIASHDMREPLRMISSYLRLLQERSPEALDDRARRYIEYACEGADRMRNLIEDLLSYARLDKTEKPYRAVALEDALAQAIDNLNASIRDTQAEVTIDINNSPVVIGDSIRLVRLFQNLIGNAIKFTSHEERPKISVYFRNGGIPGAESGSCTVAIEDRGIGIHPDHHEMLFKLFQRLNTRDEFEGSGIGLAVAKKIAEQHGGRIWFQSTYGKGSIFFVALKKADAQALGT